MDGKEVTIGSFPKLLLKRSTCKTFSRFFFQIITHQADPVA